MKPQPKAVYHHGTYHQCHGEGDVLTLRPGNPLDLSLCGACLASLIADAAGNTECDPGAVGDDEPESGGSSGSATGGAGAQGPGGLGEGGEDG